MGPAIISPIVVQIWRHIAALWGPAQTALAAEQREKPTPAEQQENRQGIDKGANHHQEQQNRLVTKNAEVREVCRRVSRRKQESSRQHGSAHDKLSERA